MTEMEVIEYISRRLDEAEEATLGVMSNGRCEDFAAYKELVGFVRALNSVEDLLDDLRKKLLEE